MGAKGGEEMALALFEHNAKAYQAAAVMLAQYGKAAVVHPTGTGKSYIAFKLIEDHPDAAFLWLSPSEYIFKTQIEGLQKQDPDFPLAKIHFFTYAKLMWCTPEQLEEIAALHPAYIIMDEFHRAGAERWGEKVQKLLELCPNAKLLGLTATSVRYLDNNRDMAEELFDGCVASEMTLGEAIVRGILPAPKYVTTVFRYQNELAKYQARVDSMRSPGVQDVNQKYLDALRRALEQADGLDRVFAKHITEKAGKYIVFCSGKEHMDEMLSHVPEWFAGVNRNINVYKTYASDPEASKEFAAFKADDDGSSLKLLFCIDMLNEGVHVKGISGVILFRPTVSPIIYKQQIGRALTAGTTAAPLILDVVNNFEGLCSIAGVQSEMSAAVQRLYANGEGGNVVTERFEVIEQVKDCRVLFEQLENSLSSTWDHYFAAASTYYAEYGSLNVPLRYKTPGGLSLGEWVQTQRSIRSGREKYGSLTPQQIERLDSIGMVWETRAETAWAKGLKAAKCYQLTHGDLNVPVGYKDKTGFALGNWLKNTKARQRDGALNADQTAALEALGIVWNAMDAKWEHFYAEAAAYFEKHGDLAFPKKYVTESGVRLGAWLENQRAAYQNGTLPAGKVKRLEAIGMLWEGRSARQWRQAYEAARQYFQEHGDLEVPYEYTTPDGLRLGQWVVRQRMAYKGTLSGKGKVNRKRLSPDRKKLLDAIGMDWREKDSWQKHYEDLLAYQKEHGTLIVPASYKTADGCWLNRWFCSQRQRLRDAPEKLTPDQRQKLEQLLGQAERTDQLHAG